MRFQIGKLYEAKNVVRKHYGEYRKGILVKGEDIAVVCAFKGARRTHYGNKVDPQKPQVTYIGEGTGASQKPNSRNRALINAHRSKSDIVLFFDCGDILSPKHLVCAGRWKISRINKGSSAGRSQYRFTLVPADEKVTDFVRTTFGTMGISTGFEDELRRLARARARLYRNYPQVMRSRDNISGQIGEYFAISKFNEKNPGSPLIRLSTTHRDVDAVQIGSGKRFAIKAIASVPGNTSNIWSKDLNNGVDAFIIVHMNPDLLNPIRIAVVSTRFALSKLVTDRHQGSFKLKIDESFFEDTKLLWKR